MIPSFMTAAFAPSPTVRRRTPVAALAAAIAVALTVPLATTVAAQEAQSPEAIAQAALDKAFNRSPAPPAALQGDPAAQTFNLQYGDRGRGGIELYSGRHFSGDARYFQGDESNLNRSGFNDRAISVRVISGGAWQLCEEANLRGRCVTLDRDEPDLGRFGLDSKISSFRQVSGGRGDDGWGDGGWNGGGWRGRLEIQLFEREDFSGRSVRFSDTVNNLDGQGFNDRARSLRVRGRWQVCDNAEFEGRCREVSGDVWDLGSIGLAGRISSIRPIDSWNGGNGGWDPGQGGSVDFQGVSRGRTAAFFPRPSIGGQPAPVCWDGGRDCQRRSAEDFCRRAGYRDAGYFTVEPGRRGDVLSEVLCVR